uniref:Integrase core domain containing protein n=1 Tax=Solanum tuberosum TaxID=4113 RepID=M1DXX8_SOLTU
MDRSSHLWFPSEPNSLGLLTYRGDPRTVGQPTDRRNQPLVATEAIVWSASGSAIGSRSHDQAASFDESTSSGEVQVPQNNDPAPVAEEPNRCHFSRLYSQKYQSIAQTPLKATLVRGFSVDISVNTIHQFLYDPSPDHTWALHTVEFDYRWDIVRGGEFQRSAKKNETLLH